MLLHRAWRWLEERVRGAPRIRTPGAPDRRHEELAQRVSQSERAVRELEARAELITRQAIADRRWALTEARDDLTVRLVARASVRNEAVGMLFKLIVVAIGLWAMATPQNPSPGAETFQAFVAVALISAVVLMNLNSAFGSNDRSRIIELEKRKRNGGSSDGGS